MITFQSAGTSSSFVRRSSRPTVVTRGSPAAVSAGPPSPPRHLRRVRSEVWVTGEKNAWVVAEALDELRHFPLMNAHHLKAVLRRDPFERRVSGVLQYPRPRALLEKLARLKKKRKK